MLWELPPTFTMELYWWIYHIFIIHASTDEYLDCFHILTIIYTAALNIHVQTFLWTCICISLGTCLGVELLGHVATLCFTAFESVSTCYFSPAVFWFLRGFVWPFNFGHFSGCEEVSHCGSDLYFPED